MNSRGTAFLAPLLLTGCINITTELQPVNSNVKPTAKGLDCVPIVLGMGFGTNRIDTAARSGYMGSDRFDNNGNAPIRNIHSIRQTDFALFNLIGHRCLEVTGEP